MKKIYLATVLVETTDCNSAYGEIIGTENDTDLETMEGWCKEEIDAVAGEYESYDESNYEGFGLEGGRGFYAKYRSSDINITIDVQEKEIEL